ncbi:hypothetical protein D3C86_1528440 [compost metagenome]
MDRFDHRRRSVASSEDFPFGIPQMRLAVHRAHTLGIDQRGTVGQFTVGQMLTETADHNDVQFPGQGLPQAQGRAIAGFRQRQRFVAIGEQIAALDQFRQHHDLSALQRRRTDRPFGEGAVVSEVADFRCQLATGDHGVFGNVQRTGSAV